MTTLADGAVRAGSVYEVEGFKSGRVYSFRMRVAETVGDWVTGVMLSGLVWSNTLGRLLRPGEGVAVQLDGRVRVRLSASSDHGAPVPHVHGGAQ